MFARVHLSRFPGSQSARSTKWAIQRAARSLPAWPTRFWRARTYQICVLTSSTGQHGLYATRDFEVGEVLGEYTGVAVSGEKVTVTTNERNVSSAAPPYLLLSSVDWQGGAYTTRLWDKDAPSCGYQLPGIDASIAGNELAPSPSPMSRLSAPFTSGQSHHIFGLGTQIPHDKRLSRRAGGVRSKRTFLAMSNPGSTMRINRRDPGCQERL